MRTTVAVAATCLSLVSLTSANDVHAAIRQPTNIAAQELAPALKMLAKDRNIQFVYRSDLVKNHQTGGAAGDLTFDESLTQLLTGTGLTFKYLENNAVTIVPIDAVRTDNTTGGAASFALTESGEAAQTSRGFGSRLQLAQNTSSTAGGNAGRKADEFPEVLDEIIVTAQKREERLLDVPVPVAVLNTEELLNSNQLRLQDYYSTVPGFSFTPSIMSGSTLALRGVTTGGISNPTVGVVVDDVPYGASSGSSGMIIPDLDPGDLARIEVLRGPQGALYGASSMGGLLKFVTVDPSTQGVSGRIQGGISDVYNGSDLGYNLRGSINLPVTDTVAVRASGFMRRDPGYIDNPVLHIDGINKTDVYGGRLAGMWKPSENFSLKLSALYQETQGDGSNNVDLPVNGYAGPPLGDLQQNYVAGVGPYDRKVQAYSAIINGKAGSVDLVSVTGYNINSWADSFDFTSIYGGFPFFLPAAPSFADAKVKKFTQEFRLSMPLGSHVDWQLGAFYDNNTTSSTSAIYSADATTGERIAEFSSLNQHLSYKEYALFTNLTFKITDRFDIMVGGRESKIKQTQTETDYSIFGPPNVLAEINNTANAFTYLLTPRFKILPDLMAYARFASGYRPGGPNVILPGVPNQSDPDKTKNYELGMKGDFLDHRLSFDASVYYIKWTDIQLPQVDLISTRSYVSNGGSAKSQGVELSVETRPVTGLTLSVSATYNDAELTEDLPPSLIVVGSEGDRLPYSSRFSGNLGAQWDFPLAARVNGFVGGNLSYVGDRKGTLSPPQSREVYPAYAKTDLHAGVKFDATTLSVFVNNLFDRRGLLTGGNGFIPAYSYNYIQPRTIGLTAAWTF